MSEHLHFNVRLRSITHLGRKLYDNLSAALAELVANSWDAYAKSVSIDFENDRIIIRDSGIGMSHSELQERYCPIGAEKKLSGIRIPSGMNERPPMGKKGIGKLAAFSLGNDYNVITKSDTDNITRKFTLNYDEMKEVEGEFSVEVKTLPVENDYFASNETGTVIEIFNLRKSITGQTKSALVKKLGRRFSLLNINNDFKVTIDSNSMDFEEKYFAGKIQFLWVFANSDEEYNQTMHSFIDTDGKETIDPSRITRENGLLETAEGEKMYFSGWIGTYYKSGFNKTEEGDNLNTIQVLHNHKVADEDIMRKISGNEMSRSYLVGRIDADFINHLDDPITSSRQGLDDSIPEVICFIEFIDKKLKEIINTWAKERPLANVKIIEDRYPDVAEWVKTYKDNISAQKVLKAMFQSIAKIEFHDQSQERLIIKNAIFAFEDAFTMNTLLDFHEALGEENQQIEHIILKFRQLAHLEAIKYRKIIDDRLSIITKLEEHIQENAKEKILHKLLYDHLWLIDPHWDDIDDYKVMEKKLQNEFNEKNPKIKDKRFDILLRQPNRSSNPVLIELKRPDPLSYMPTKYQINEQIDNYRESAARYYSDTEGRSIRGLDIKCILVWQENDHIDKLNQEDLDKFLYQNNIEILKYSRILNNVNVMYRDFIEESRRINTKLGFLESDEWRLKSEMTTT